MKKLLAGLLFTGLIVSTTSAFAVCPLGGCPKVEMKAPKYECVEKGCPLPCMNELGKPAMTAAQAAACPHCRYLLNTCPTCPCPEMPKCPCPIS